MPTITPSVKDQIYTYTLKALPDPQSAHRPELAEYARLLRDYPERGGKMLRGSLLVYAGLAHGSTLEQLLPIAAALELFQNWALIHDDIEDASEERRGKPALHKLYGIPLALNAGDALHGLMWRILVDTAPKTVLVEFAKLVELTAQGQHLEMTWMQQQRLDLSEADYLEMVGKKAAYYTAVAPLHLGILTANQTPSPLVAQAGMELGTGFQIMDDVLNLGADPTKYGKEIGGDLLEGKRTLILLHFLKHCTPSDRARAEALLRIPREHKNPSEVTWLHQQLSASIRYGPVRACHSPKCCGENFAHRFAEPGAA
jgi:geranylgeranyl diphosphate synthase, type II